MRGRLGAAVAVVAISLGVGAGAGLGCSHESRPAIVAPDEHPPLPPASGTPIGYLVDDAAELKLSDDQLTRLKAIDSDLAARLEVLDGELRGPGPAASSGQNTGRRRGGRGRGRGMGRMGGGGPGAGSGSGAGSGGRRQRPSGAGNASNTGRVTEERAADVRDAIDRSFALLDAVQRVMARRVLAEHGVDLDAGRLTRPTAGGESAGAGEEPDEPAEPDEPGGPGAGSGSG